MTIRTWMIAVVCCLAAFAAEPAGAQSYPTRLIRIVVPFPPGGPTDVAARLVVQPLSETLGQSIIIENQAGAGGRTGSRYVARAAPDGYTLLLGGTNLNAIIAAIYKGLDYEPVRSFVPVAAIASDSMVMVVNPALPVKSVAELVAYAKAHPGKLKYGSAPGIASHLASELLKYRAGIDVPFIPYRGGAPAITDLLGGQIDVLFNNKSVLLALIEARKLRALAVTSDARWPELPEVPTMRESGFADFPADIHLRAAGARRHARRRGRDTQWGGQQGDPDGRVPGRSHQARHRCAGGDRPGIRRQPLRQCREVPGDRPVDRDLGGVRPRPTPPPHSVGSAPAPAG